MKDFEKLAEGDTDAQCEHFMKSFIFALGDDWKSVHKLGSKFKKYLVDHNEDKDLSPVEAADFLQHEGAYLAWPVPGLCLCLAWAKPGRDIFIHYKSFSSILIYFCHSFVFVLLGKTRTGLQRKQELRDVDVNNDDRICFIEYLMLHYKVLILTEYYKRKGLEPEEDLTNDGNIWILYAI